MQPQPLPSFSKPSAQLVVPTGAHVAPASVGMVPGSHVAGGKGGSVPVVSLSEVVADEEHPPITITSVAANARRTIFTLVG